MYVHKKSPKNIKTFLVEEKQFFLSILLKSLKIWMPRTLLSCVVLWKVTLYCHHRSEAEAVVDQQLNPEMTESSLFTVEQSSLVTVSWNPLMLDDSMIITTVTGRWWEKARKDLKDGKNLGQWNCKRLWRHPFDLMEWRSIGQRNHCYQTIVQGRCLTSKSGQCSQAIIQPHSMSSPQLPRQTTIVVSILSSKTTTPSRLLTSD